MNSAETSIENCVICLNSLEGNCATFPQCGHRLHDSEECIEQYFRLTIQNQCPICRMEVDFYLNKYGEQQFVAELNQRIGDENSNSDSIDEYFSSDDEAIDEIDEDISMNENDEDGEFEICSLCQRCMNLNSNVWESCGCEFNQTFSHIRCANHEDLHGIHLCDCLNNRSERLSDSDFMLSENSEDDSDSESENLSEINDEAKEETAEEIVSLFSTQNDDESDSNSENLSDINDELEEESIPETISLFSSENESELSGELNNGEVKEDDESFEKKESTDSERTLSITPIWEKDEIELNNYVEFRRGGYDKFPDKNNHNTKIEENSSVEILSKNNVYGKSSVDFFFINSNSSSPTKFAKLKSNDETNNNSNDITMELTVSKVRTAMKNKVINERLEKEMKSEINRKRKLDELVENDQKSESESENISFSLPIKRQRIN